MKPWNLLSFDRGLAQLHQWVNHSSLQKLETAYSVAVAIQAIEAKHFNGKSVASDSNKGKIITDYCPNALVQNYPLSVGGFSCYSFLA